MIIFLNNLRKQTCLIRLALENFCSSDIST